MKMNKNSYYPFDRLAIRLSSNNLIIEGFYWLSSYWGIFERVNGKWVEYHHEEDVFENVIKDFYIHCSFRDLKDLTVAYDGWKEIESTLEEPLDYSFCEDFRKSYDFESAQPVAAGYPPLNSFYEIYRWSRNFIDEFFDGLNDPLFGDEFIGASERDTQYQEVLRYQSYRLDYEAEIKRRRTLSNLEAEALELTLEQSHPILLDYVARLHEAAYVQYKLECKRLGINDDWALFYPTIKYIEFLDGTAQTSSRELLEVGEYFSELLMHGSRNKSGLTPIRDPRSTSEWYKKTMKVKIEVVESNNKVAIKLCNCESKHDEFHKEDHVFPDGTKENLPTICVENELYPDDLYHEFQPILKTLESDENWAMNSYFVGLVAEIRPDIYFYRFGDVDEIGESNFYIKGDLKSVIYLILREWGPSGKWWQALLRNIGSHGYPKGYEPGSMFSLIDYFPNAKEETLTLGFSYNLEKKELHQIMRELDL